MKKLKPIEYIFITAIIFGGVLIDQISKLIISSSFSLGESMPIIKDVLHLTYIHNRGAAFGMMANSRWVFMIISSVAILLMAAYLYIGRAESKLYTVSLAIIISGGIGNMIDRIAYGYVIDFIDFCLIDFYVFNIADSFVCVGAGLLILALVLDIIKEARVNKKS
jgi:signal peptidase II